MTGTSAPGEPGEAIGSPVALASAIRGGGLRTGAYLAAALLSLVSLPLLVRHLGVTEFGRYIAVVTAVNVAGLVADLGLTSIGLRSYEDGRGELRGDRLVRAILGLRLAVSVLLLGGVVVFFALAGYPGRVVLG